jgi:hypothetical protein
MTIIKYKINNQTSRNIIADDWASAQKLREQTKNEEISQFGWWSIISEITNNDGSVTHCPIDTNGIPQMWDDTSGTVVPYVDNTISPD